VAGSYLLLGHGTDEGNPAVTRVVQKVYNRSVSTGGRFRSRSDILRFFDGFELVEPGLVYIPQWRPDSLADVPSNPSEFLALVGVGRKG
jgi:S-adenosyl methyltransferase